MRIRCDRLNLEELSDCQQVDYLVTVVARVSVLDRGTVILDEEDFPVLEFAWSLAAWLRGSGHKDYQFDSMSLEEPKLVAITRGPGGWILTSSLNPGVLSAPLQWHEVQEGCTKFVDRVRGDLLSRNLDPHAILN